MIRSFINRARTFEEGSRAKVETWSLRGIALIIAGMGVLNMLTWFKTPLSPLLNPLEQLSPFSIQPSEPLSKALLGFILIILADGLWRRKRIAWLIGLIVLAASSISYLNDDPGYSKAVTAIILGLGILSLTPRFNARSDQSAILKALRILAISFSITLLYGVVGFYILTVNHGGEFNLGESLHQSLIIFTQFYDPKILYLSIYSPYFVYSISTISAISLGYSLFLALLPVQLQIPPTDIEKNRALTIVQNHGRSSMARLTLVNDNSFFFSRGGSVISYTIQGRYALVLGDPIGPDEDIPSAIREFQTLCEKNDWRSAYCLTMPDYLTHYRQAGFGVLCLGHEAIVNLHSFSLAGGANKIFRQRFNLLTKMGFRVIIYQPPIPDEVIRCIREISDEWLIIKGKSEKRFLLGWFDEDYIRSGPIAVVQTPEGQISAFANIVTEYQQNEITVDLVRRREKAELRTMDFLFVSLFKWAREHEYDTFNMRLCPLYGVGIQPNPSFPERFVKYVYEHGNFFYNFKGLKEFKAKFHPRWSPQYLIYPDLSHLPFVWLNMVRVNAGEQGSVWEYFLPKGKKKSSIPPN
jgi:phosphatidylglycerol lysyltransferase